MLAHKKVCLIDWIFRGRIRQATRIILHVSGDLTHREGAEGTRVVLILNRHHDGVVTLRMAGAGISVAGIEVVTEFMRRDSHAKRSNRLAVGNPVGLGWVRTDDAHPDR